MQKIVPFLWYDGKAEEAMNFYLSVFKNGKVINVSGYGDGDKRVVVSVTFQLFDQEFMALNGGPLFTFSPAISLFVKCDSQQEVDEIWEKLSEGGEKQRCGWLKDRYGVSWQIIPNELGKSLNNPDPIKAKKAMDAMLKMDKIDISALLKATE